MYESTFTEMSLVPACPVMVTVEPEMLLSEPLTP